MSASNIIGNRNSTPEASSSSSLRPPGSRTMGAGHHLRASADMGAFTAQPPLSARGIRPASEIYLNNFQQGAASANPDDAAEKAAQQWMTDIEQYETTLEDMASATLDQDFKDELSAIEQWFRVLSEPERTAALYALLQQTTQMQIRFFIQVLQQMAKSHPMSGVLSPAAFGEKDPMSSRMNDAMNKLNVEGSRGSFGFGTKPPPSPGAKRMSGLDPSTIKSMFPDAANAIEDQKAEFQKTTGTAPKSNRNSAVGDRSSFLGPDDDSQQQKKNATSGIPAGPWRSAGSNGNNENQPPIGRPKSSSGQQAPMGQFGLSNPPPSAGGLRSPRPFPISGDNNIQSQSATVADSTNQPMGHGILSPYAPGASWASMSNTPMVSNFNHAQQGQAHADMVANATAMKLAAMSTVNNRIQLDDVRKYRRARSNEGQQQNPLSPGLPSGINLTNEYGQVLTPQQALALQQQQLASMQGGRSRPSSPGIAITGPHGATSQIPMGNGMQNNGFLAAFDGSQLSNGFAGLNLNAFPMGGSNEGYLSDASEITRGRSPRGRRGSSKPPEDPTDIALLKDIPSWLRTLRLHKYTDNLKDMRWQDLVALDDAGLDAKGVNALGARRKLLKVCSPISTTSKDYLLTKLAGLRTSPRGAERGQVVEDLFVILMLPCDHVHVLLRVSHPRNCICQPAKRSDTSD